MSVCSYLGTEIKPIAEGVSSYECNHPQVMWTVEERCSCCPFKTYGSIPVDKILDDSTCLEEDSPLDTLPKDPKGLAKRKPPQKLGQDLPGDTIVNRDCQPAHMGNLYYGASCFLVLSGPSLKKIDLSLLNQRGIFTMAVNNAATVIRPNFWVHVDPPEKFHSIIWDDPGIIKLVPVREFGKHRRIPGKNGEPIHPVTFAGDNPQMMFRYLARNSPGVFGYQRHADFNPDSFLREGAVCWGNSNKCSQRNGRPHVLNVMFAALKLVYYLGFRTLYLLGCDFDMSPGKVYCFDEGKALGAMDSNNGTYRKLTTMFGWLKPKFDEAGFKVFNCNSESKLSVFPFLSYEGAIHDASKSFRQEIRTEGWYTKYTERR